LVSWSSLGISFLSDFFAVLTLIGDEAMIKSSPSGDNFFIGCTGLDSGTGVRADEPELWDACAGDRGAGAGVGAASGGGDSEVITRPRRDMTPMMVLVVWLGG
jgi:hypothetical protein